MSDSEEEKFCFFGKALVPYDEGMYRNRYRYKYVLFFNLEASRIISFGVDLCCTYVYIFL